ncbi:MAG: tRNA (adenosine(37)-N6)-threonylcarbamoyltransferase complex ATPase subunit type 1 TsaE [Acidobacteriota bacterium]|nr:tRNA (adenosine(37)-N6)-threonylcarbamoyltransferase complex ATPase subunit type 1 TsaE [Acidobacteriota bacterium]MDQ5873211.1 tRNA (adenosine(37)-N6)-threonylcarbamoyltransferase complex ATPase subunit type 1 TsaE [Acidobacteriota bacterium]
MRPEAKGLAPEFLSKSEEETEAFGRALAADLSSSDVVYLIGELGAGKTALSRGIAAGLGAAPREVASPTFAILNEYASPGGSIVLRHLDLYRLADRPGDLEVLGLPDAVAGSPIAVEWPGAAIRATLPPTVEIRLSTGPGGTRRIDVERVEPRSG